MSGSGPDETVASSPEGQEQEGVGRAEGGSSIRKRGISEKRLKVIIVVAVVAVIVIILLWGMVPERIYEVHEVVEDIDHLDGETVNVKGLIVLWDISSVNFTLADQNNHNLTIRVHHKGAIPEGFGINVTAVVKGVLHQDGPQYRLDSEKIQIGCPSKY